MDYDDKKGCVGETRDLLEEYITPEITTVEEPGSGLEVPIILKGNAVEYVPPAVFDAYRDNPVRRHGRAGLTRIDSLIDHVNRFKDEDSALFASEDRHTPSLMAVLDYHQRANLVVGSDGTSDVFGAAENALPRFGEHRSVFEFPLSDEWKAWQENDGKPMTMHDFARFLEDRIVDVIDLIPGEDKLGEQLEKFIATCGGVVASPARLVELSRNLQVYEKAVIGEAVNLSSGEAQIEIASEHQDKQGYKLTVPNVFLIAIPVFRHDMLYRIAARLRYRKAGGLVFWYDLWRADNAFDDAFGNACERVRVQTDLPLFYGKPE